MDIKTEADALRDELSREHRALPNRLVGPVELAALRAQIEDLKRELSIAVAEAGPDYVLYGHADRVKEKYAITTPLRLPNAAKLLHDTLSALDGFGCRKAASQAIRRAVGMNFSA